jgi:hypothetical protein
MKALQLSVSQPYALRVPSITYLDPALGITDPRPLFTPQFQLLSPEATTFNAIWAPGLWDTRVPPSGPYAVSILVGPGQPAPVNPGKPGAYVVKMKMWQGFATGETPVFNVGTVILETP